MVNWSGERVLVTGAGGFLGSNLVYALHRLGAHVVGMLPNRSETHSLETRGLVDKMDVWYGDVQDDALVRRLLGKYDITTVFHLAAISQVRRAASGPVDTFETNIRGTWVLLDACRRRHGFRAFVGASSDKAYGDHGGVAYTEEMALRASNTYDVSKACADMLTLSAAHQYSMPTVVTRCANLYGPGDLNWDRIIPNTLRRLHRGQAPVIHAGASEYRRAFLSVWDAVAAYLMLASRIEQTAGKAYNVSTSTTATVAEVIERVSTLAGRHIPPEQGARDRNFKEIPTQALDSSRMEQLGWSARMPFDEGLKRTVAWYQRFFESGQAPPLDPGPALTGLD